MVLIISIAFALCFVDAPILRFMEFKVFDLGMFARSTIPSGGTTLIGAIGEENSGEGARGTHCNVPEGRS